MSNFFCSLICKNIINQDYVDKEKGKLNSKHEWWQPWGTYPRVNYKRQLILCFKSSSQGTKSNAYEI